MRDFSWQWDPHRPAILRVFLTEADHEEWQHPLHRGQLLEPLASLVAEVGAEEVWLTHGVTVVWRGISLEEARKHVPEQILDDLDGQHDAFALEMCWRWLLADEPERQDILAFHESQGPEKVRRAMPRALQAHEQAKLDEPGIPTADELKQLYEV